MEMVDMVEKKIPFVDDLVCAIQPISRKKTEKSWLWGHSHAKSLGKDSDWAKCEINTPAKTDMDSKNAP